ncbi:MAG: AraC family transcriptional regulator, partial [Sphingomonas sp.]|nr:AraC family transcriptional regulator [Sphingomonas sp.]
LFRSMPAPAAPAAQPLARGGLAPHRLRRVSDHVDAHLGEPLLLVDLAQIAKLSPKHFSRAFTQSVGKSPHRWLIEKRVVAAQAMLRASDKSLSDIALACGFADQSHFTALFRRHVGAPPGRWREAVRDALH